MRQLLQGFLGCCAVATLLLLAGCGQQAAPELAGDAVAPQATATAVIDFEGLPPGGPLASVSAGNGISGHPFAGSVAVFGHNPNPLTGTAGQNFAAVFDATCGGSPAGCSGTNAPDTDLYQPTLGKVLIVNEDADFSDPDDADRRGAHLRFDLTGFGPGTFVVESLVLLDVEAEEAPATIQLFGSGGLLETVSVGAIGDGQKAVVPLNVAGVQRIRVNLQGSAAVDNIRLKAEVREPGGSEGCTPGYWRQPHHYDSWRGYAPTDSYRAVFGVGPRMPLGDTIKARGGGENAFLRHSTAALLNAAAGLDYAYTEAEVKAAVTATYASGAFERQKNLFAAANETGCPLN